MRRFIHAALVSAMTLVAILVGGGSASADRTCVRGEYCVTEHADFGGAAFTTPYTLNNYVGIRMFTATGLGVYLNDQVTSWWNNGYSGAHSRVHSYRDAYGGGGSLWAGWPQMYSTNVGWANDAATSHVWRSY